VKSAFTVSVALAALLAMPAFAQTTSTTAPHQSTATAASHDQLMTSLKSAGVSQVTQVNGQVMEAQTSNGAPAFVVVVPKGFTGTISGNETELKTKLSKAGLKDISPVTNEELVKGVVNDQDKDLEGVLAVSGLNFSNSKSTADINKSQLIDAMKSAGISEESNFRGKLASAETQAGKKIYMIIGDENLTPDGGKFSFDDSKVRSAFDKAHLKQLKMLDDTQIVQGQMNGDTVFVVGGKDLSKG